MRTISENESISELKGFNFHFSKTMRGLDCSVFKYQLKTWNYGLAITRYCSGLFKTVQVFTGIIR